MTLNKLFLDHTSAKKGCGVTPHEMWAVLVDTAPLIYIVCEEFVLACQPCRSSRVLVNEVAKLNAMIGSGYYIPSHMAGPWLPAAQFMFDAIVTQNTRQLFHECPRCRYNANDHMWESEGLMCANEDTSVAIDIATDEVGMKAIWDRWILKDVCLVGNDTKFSQPLHDYCTGYGCSVNAGIIHSSWAVVFQQIVELLNKVDVLRAKHKLLAVGMDGSVGCQQAQYPCHFRCPGVKELLVEGVFSSKPITGSYPVGITLSRGSSWNALPLDMIAKASLCYSNGASYDR